MDLVARLKLLRQPWILTILLITAMPLLPEYVAPLLAIGALAAACRDARRHHRRCTTGPLGKVMLVYILFLAVGIRYTDNLFSVAYTALFWAVIYLAYIALHTVLTSRDRLDVALLGISASAGAVGLVACVQYAMRTLFGFAGHLQLWYRLDTLVYRLSPTPVNLEVVGDRACSTFGNPNIMAEYLIMVIPFVTLFAFSGERTRSRLFSRGCLLFAVAGVWFSFSRGSYLALLGMAAIWAIANIQRISLAFLAAFSALALTPTAVMDRLLSINRVKDSAPVQLGNQLVVPPAGGDKAISERFQVWSACLENFLEHPLLGLGAGVGNSGDMLTAAGLKNVPHAHNIVLQLATEGGLVALGIFLTAGLGVLRTGIRLIRRDRRTARAGAAVLAFAVGFCVVGMVDFPLFTPKLVGTFLMVLALVDTAGRLRPTGSVSPLLQKPTHSRFKCTQPADSVHR